MVADLALAWLESSPDLPVAAATVDLCRRWYDGERFDLDRFEKAYADEDGGGLAGGAMMRAPSRSLPPGTSSQAIMYIAFQAYREIGRYPAPMLSEMEADELNEMYRHMQTASPMFIETARGRQNCWGRDKNYRSRNSKKLFRRGRLRRDRELRGDRRRGTGSPYRHHSERHPGALDQRGRHQRSRHVERGRIRPVKAAP